MADPMVEDDDDLYSTSEAQSKPTMPASDTESGRRREHQASGAADPGLENIPNTLHADNSEIKSTLENDVLMSAESAPPAPDLRADTSHIASAHQQPDVLPGLENASAAAADQPTDAPAKESAHVPDEAETALANTAGGERAVVAAAIPVIGGENTPQVQNDAPEYEVDSSPYESSSDDSSDSSSEDDSSDDDYPLMDPREQARMLMADAGSDDEGSKKDGRARAPRTQNEQIDEIVEMPEIDITADMKIEELGKIQAVIDNVALIRAKVSGEQKILETSSVLCLEDRKLIGVVAETIGRVEEPMYVVRFTNPTTLVEMGVEVGKTIYFVPSHAHFLFTKTLNIKGSDASNLHDEEVADNEIDFSDDEAEAAYKASLKKQRQARRDARNPQPIKSQLNHNMSGPSELIYDDNAGNEDLYTPLARPTNFTQGGGQMRAPRGGGGGGNRGRGRGNHSGRGRGQNYSGQPPRGAQSSNYSQPPSHMGGAGGPASPQNGSFVPQVPPMIQQNAQVPVGQFMQPQQLMQMQGFAQPFHQHQQHQHQHQQQSFAYQHQQPQLQPQPQTGFPVSNMAQYHVPPQMPPGTHAHPGFFFPPQAPQQQQQQQQQQQHYYPNNQNDNDYNPPP